MQGEQGHGGDSNEAQTKLPPKRESRVPSVHRAHMARGLVALSPSSTERKGLKMREKCCFWERRKEGVVLQHRRKTEKVRFLRHTRALPSTTSSTHWRNGTSDRDASSRASKSTAEMLGKRKTSEPYQRAAENSPHPKQKEPETTLQTDLNILTEAFGDLKKHLESEIQKLTPEMDADKKRKKCTER